MSQQFKFNILTGENAQTKYDAITTKEPFTFYLLQTGVGYLGEKKLFDAASLENTEVTLTGKFFRAVASHVITQTDLDNANLSKPNGTAVGDAGILFTADNNETDDGDESKYFVPVKIPNTVATIDGDNPGNDIPTATAVVNYINQVLGNYVTFEVDGVAGTPVADGTMAFPGAYSTDEVRIGTWIDGKPLYRKVVTGKTPPNINQQATLATIDTNLNIKRIIGMFTVVDSDSNGLTIAPLPLCMGSNYIVTIYYTSKDGCILAQTDTSSFCNCNAEIIVEYTKQTSTGGT